MRFDPTFSIELRGIITPGEFHRSIMNVNYSYRSSSFLYLRYYLLLLIIISIVIVLTFFVVDIFQVGTINGNIGVFVGVGLGIFAYVVL